MPLTLDDFDYALPRALVAQHPAEKRAGSRLLRLAGEAVSDHAFTELPDFVDAGDVLVFNDTRVMKARLFGEKATGGRIEVLVERVLGRALVLAPLRASHAPRAGARLRLAGAFEASVIERRGELYVLRFEAGESAFALVERHGALPLPPYITHAPSSASSKCSPAVGAATAPGARA